MRQNMDNITRKFLKRICIVSTVISIGCFLLVIIEDLQFIAPQWTIYGEVGYSPQMVILWVIAFALLAHVCGALLNGKTALGVPENASIWRKILAVIIFIIVILVLALFGCYGVVLGWD